MPSQSEWEEMLRRMHAQEQVRQFNASGRSRFYGRDPQAESQRHYVPPPLKNCVLRPVPTPGVKLELQENALRVLRQQLAQPAVGQALYFHGDRINIFDLGLLHEPPLLAGMQCKVSETGIYTEAAHSPGVPMIKVARLPQYWIDVAYFGAQLPILQILRHPV